MSKVKGKEELCRTDLRYFKALQGIEGKTLFDRKQSLENIVKIYIDAEYQDFLAHPVKDGDQITFYGKKHIQQPQYLSDLQGDELAKYQNIKIKTLAHFNDKINSLKASDRTDDAEFLSKATRYVDDRFVFCYDDKVVLGVWGMQLRDNVREDIREICKDLADKQKVPESVPVETEIPAPIQEISPAQPEPSLPTPLYTVRFDAGEDGTLKGYSELTKRAGEFVTYSEVPQVKAKKGYEFIGWDKDPMASSIDGDTEFTAQYRQKEKSLPWWKRFWAWLTGWFTGLGCLSMRGCLKWLLYALLLLLLIFLLSKLFRGCSGLGGGGFGGGGSDRGGGGRGGGGDGSLPNQERVDRIRDDENAGRGGIYNPGDPYNPTPTPPGRGDLPPYQGTLPPLDTTQIIREPGNPVIVGNRLNILMENLDKSIMDLARDFKVKYPDDKYKIVYYDDVVKRMQLEVPNEERARLKEEIPAQLPEYDLFIFDEALFEVHHTPNDPAFSDPDKSWYLRAINAPQAWAITKGSDSLTIAIVDNGFNLRHPELSSKVVMPYNVWTRSPEVYPQHADHGTHVAGTALAIMDNRIGLCGIAPNAAFMPVQIADRHGNMTTTSVLDGVLYALYQGADVINVSLGMQFGGALPENMQRDMQDNRFKEEERVWNHVMKISSRLNVTIVIAAGNDNMLAGVDPMNRPTDFIIVSAVDRDNRAFSKAGFSNHGDFSTISAPGVDIYSTVGANDYRKESGTSMAAPIISGAVALMKSLNRNLTTEQIICILQGTGIATDNKIGNLIQLDKALQRVQSGEFVDCTPTNPIIPPDNSNLDALLRERERLQRELERIDREIENIRNRN